MHTMKWKEYFIELLIVIIGITAAFSLNNLAEAGKENNLERKYLEDIRSDLVRDSTLLDKSIRFSRSKLTRIENIVGLLLNDPQRQYADSLLTSISIVGSYNFFYPESFTINSLLVSGDLKLIQSRELKKELLRLKWRYDFVERDQINFTNAMDQNYYPKVLQEYDMISAQARDIDFFYSIQYRNWMLYVNNDSNNILNDYLIAQQQIRKVLEIIDIQLNS